ncbi:MAG: class I SAM-dependent methyltransferase [Desulfobulbaceae bacterium]|nr:class I SAM-dependent methyltransferase [Desulfobulbaceae bacterium]
MKIFSTNTEKDYMQEMEEHLRELSSKVKLSYIANNFAKYVRRQELTRFMVRHELFKKILHQKGSIVECGVFSGNGVMSWAQLSAIMEPVAFFRRIYGFDTFAGFPSVAAEDLTGKEDLDWKPGDLKDDSYQDLLTCIDLFDKNRFLSQFPKVELVKGDFMETGERFLKENPHVVIALLYLDFDLYEPTRKALELFLPRMPKGSILAFDEINNPMWPGETMAFLESLNIRELRIEKFPYEPNMAYVEL